ncbi:hypothetical protein OHB04_22870 [Streptomyces sp. NBC_01775]|uniref:hypothetical protein n=1 Tax=Streptomyces sp. NBC_01775 TaxID=2975939 RepID=UPI002DDA8FBE|nr:hypothetical protein [Streptomyces sp. NBC_01775]WSB78338.1 hypothetical protein OHB04_22870 [Streptomyces sp. NBC_01775]
MTTTPRTWSVGEIVTAAYMNAEIRDQFASFLGAWTSWTPAWYAEGGANPTIGNGELSGRYLKVGRTVDWTLQLRWGSTTAAGGGGGSENWMFGLPASPATGFTYRIVNADAYDSSSGLHSIGHAVYSTSNGGVVKTFVSARADVNGIWDSTLPFTYANGDFLYVWGRYEAAS